MKRIVSILLTAVLLLSLMSAAIAEVYYDYDPGTGNLTVWTDNTTGLTEISVTGQSSVAIGMGKNSYTFHIDPSQAGDITISAHPNGALGGDSGSWTVNTGSNPTAAPTAEPTAAPTAEPTAAPTTEPTAAPTAEPTAAPTAEPTAAPTAEPTAAPTAEPTTAPTAETTAAPTAEPTAAPTAGPTAAPTAEPTAVPTAEPTAVPGGPMSISVVSVKNGQVTVRIQNLNAAAGQLWIDGQSTGQAVGQDGTITLSTIGLGGGSHTITLNTVNGNASASFDVTVNTPSITARYEDGKVIFTVSNLNGPAALWMGSQSTGRVISSDGTYTLDVSDLEEGSYSLILNDSIYGVNSNSASFTVPHTHTFGEWKVTKKATCTEEGEETATCTKCGKTEIRTIAKTDHTLVKIPGKPATCTETGLTDGEKCSVCGTVIKEQTVIPKADHKIVTIPGEDATCTASGMTEGKKCSVCGTVIKAQTSIPALGHSIFKVPGKAATCTEKGLTEGEKCSVCGKVVKAQTEIPTTGHTIVKVPGKAATCTEKGLTEGEKCSVCGKVVKAQTEIPTTGHTIVKVPGKAATCTEKGLTEGEKCSVCGAIIKAQEEIPMIAHTVEIIPGAAATCTKTGLTEGEKCSVCGKIVKEQQKIDALGHQYKVSDRKNNSITYRCVRCGDTFTSVKNYVADNLYGYIVKSVDGLILSYKAAADSQYAQILVITVDLKNVTETEVSLYLDDDLIALLQEEGYTYVEFVNGDVKLLIELAKISPDLFDIDGVIKYYVFTTDRAAEKGRQVKLQALLTTEELVLAKDYTGLTIR